MDRSHQLYLFIFLTTTLFTDINPTGDSPHSWFDAQTHCVGQGLTKERDKSDQPYWTGVYRRLSPWINILGCYPIESLHDVMNKTMIISSVRMCQEICHYNNIDHFAIKKNECLCIECDIHRSPSNGLSASDCNFECEDKADDTYSRDCGGENAYNVYETQGVHFNSVETCLSLQCTEKDTGFIPQNCSKSLDKMCDNWLLPDNAYGSNWSLSMEQCRKSQPSRYLLGDFSLSNPHLVCDQIPSQFKVVWVGVARLKYTSIDQGREISEKQRKTFLECQLCTNNDCCFKSCYDLAANSIFCKTDTSQRQETGNLTTSHANFLSNHLTAKQLLDQHSTIKNCDEAQLPSIQDTHQKSNANDNLALKISLPLILGIIILLVSAVGVVFYRRRIKMAKTDRTTKAEVVSVPKSIVDSKLDPVQNQSYFELEQCSQKIHTVNDSPNESPYNKSEDGDYDHLRDKKSRKPEVEDTYQHASDITKDMSEYDTMANTDNKKQEEGASYDYSHLDSYGNYACDLHASNHLTDNPYDVAV